MYFYRFQVQFTVRKIRSMRFGVFIPIRSLALTGCVCQHGVRVWQLLLFFCRQTDRAFDFELLIARYIRV
jgi:hypothetical protein